MPPRAVLSAPFLRWSAGAAFVGSLTYFAWTYLVRFDHLGPGTRLSAVVVNAALFGGFALHHSVLARPWAKQVIAARVPSWLERSAFVWIASVLFFIVCREWQPVAGVLYWHTGGAAVVHTGVQLTGVAIVGGAARTIGPLDLAGVPPPPAGGELRRGKSVSLAAGRRPRGSPNQKVSGPQVATHGPYKMVRHPIYLGWVLMVFGTPHMNGTRLSFSVISTLYVLVAMRWEERALLGRLGVPYAEYLAQVRWRLIPGLY